MNGEKSLHPFFTKINGQHEPNGATSGDETDQASGMDGAQDVSGNEQKMTKKRKSKDAVNGKTQRTLDQIVNPPAESIEVKAKGRFDGLEIPNSCSSDPVIEPARKKRRASPIEPVVEQREPEVAVVRSNNGSPVTPPRQSSPQVIIPASSPLLAAIPQPVSSPPPTAPKKMLRLNATGKFSSPPSKKGSQAKSKDEESAIDPPKKRGRPRKSKDLETIEPQHHVVIIKYANEGEQGYRIERILSGEERVHNEIKVTPRKRRSPRKQVTWLPERSA